MRNRCLKASGSSCHHLEQELELGRHVSKQQLTPLRVAESAFALFCSDGSRFLNEIFTDLPSSQRFLETHLKPNFYLRFCQSQRLCKFSTFRPRKVSLNWKPSFQLKHLSMTESRPTPLLPIARSIFCLFAIHLIVCWKVCGWAFTIWGRTSKINFFFRF